MQLPCWWETILVHEMDRNKVWSVDSSMARIAAGNKNTRKHFLLRCFIFAEYWIYYFEKDIEREIGCFSDNPAIFVAGGQTNASAKQYRRIGFL